MKGIDYNKEVPLPPGAYFNHSDRTVFYRKEDAATGKIKKENIGKLIDDKEGMMNPSFTFEQKNADYIKQYYSDHKILPFEYHYGLYALCLGVIQKIGLYSILEEVYEITSANAILDFCMFSIQYKTCTAQLFESTMERQILFSSKRHSDHWYSNFFKRTINEDLNHEFRIRWVKQLKKNGLKSVWLSIDGSNNDCEVKDAEISEYGHPKSHNTSKKIVGYMYAVDAESGRPVTYFVYEGSAPDNRIFTRMATFLNSFEIEIKGVILDRNFATDNIIRLIKSFEWKYVIMLPSDTNGHIQMINDYGALIRWKTKYRVPQTGLFGYSDIKKLFLNHDTLSTISLFFNGIKGGYEAVSIINNVDNEIERLNTEIKKGKVPAVKEQFKKYLTVKETETGCEIIENNDIMDAALEGTGYFSMATSDEMNPSEAYYTYGLRNPSEVQYCILKSQEGCHTTRVHSQPGILSKFATSFISSIIRCEIQIACLELKLDTNPTIALLNRIAIMRNADDTFSDERNASKDQLRLFAKFDMSSDELTRISQDANMRLKPGNWSQKRRIPDKIETIIVNSRKRGPRKKQEEKPTDTTELEPRLINKGGRPKGKKDTKPRKPRSDKGKPRKIRDSAN